MENNNYYYEMFNKHSIAVHTPKFKNCLKKDHQFLFIDLENEKIKAYIYHFI